MCIFETGEGMISYNKESVIKKLFFKEETNNEQKVSFDRKSGTQYGHGFNDGMFDVIDEHPSARARSSTGRRNNSGKNTC